MTDDERERPWHVRRDNRVQLKRMSFPITVADQLLKRTIGRCTVCQAPCPAEVWRVGGGPAQVFLKRTCPKHGEASVCIASDARFYWLAQGNPENASGCCSGADASLASTGRPPCCFADGAPAGTAG